MSIERKTKVPSDIEIAQAAKIRPISEVAKKYGITDENIDHYGSFKAKT